MRRLVRVTVLERFSQRGLEVGTNVDDFGAGVGTSAGGGFGGSDELHGLDGAE